MFFRNLPSGGAAGSRTSPKGGGTAEGVFSNDWENFSNRWKNWFFGDYSGTTSGIPRMQGTRRATGHSPLREGGGAAMNGRRMHGKRQAAGAATGGVLRSAVAASATSHRNNRINHSADGACESLHRRPPAVLPPPPFPSTSHSQSISHLPAGGPPLSEGGECSRTFHSPNISPRSLGHPPGHYNSRRTKFVSNRWKKIIRRGGGGRRSGRRGFGSGS